ncbi:MAG: hypothetical protein HRT35_36450, partial [Algicola sp.]|nr:hypothetical protein [Algicola sp.]
QHAQIVGFISYFETDEMIYSGLVGHQDDSGDNGTYRSCIRWLIDLAQTRQKTLHLSSGAGEFKRRRGAKAQMEYDYIVFDHLPRWRQAGWWLLGKIFNTLGYAVMTKLKV